MPFAWVKTTLHVQFATGQFVWNKEIDLLHVFFLNMEDLSVLMVI